jgi:hypothetical protein
MLAEKEAYTELFCLRDTASKKKRDRRYGERGVEGRSEREIGRFKQKEAYDAWVLC